MMAKMYQVRPSQILNLQQNDYEAFCFDEACAVLINRISNGKEIHFKEDRVVQSKEDNLISFLKEFEEKNGR